MINLIRGAIYKLNMDSNIYYLKLKSVTINNNSDKVICMKCVCSVINNKYSITYNVGEIYYPKEEFLINNKAVIFIEPYSMVKEDDYFIPSKGCVCYKCGLNNQYAEPNCSNGKYICYNCRG